MKVELSEELISLLKFCISIACNEINFDDEDVLLIEEFNALTQKKIE